MASRRGTRLDIAVEQCDGCGEDVITRRGPVRRMCASCKRKARKFLKPLHYAKPFSRAVIEVSKTGEPTPEADEDTREQALSAVQDLANFAKEVGKQWVLVRNLYVPAPLGPLSPTTELTGYKTVDGRNFCRIYRLFPRRLVVMLDSAGDVYTCSQEGENCFEPVHKDWDFCEFHGEDRSE